MLLVLLVLVGRAGGGSGRSAPIPGFAGVRQVRPDSHWRRRQPGPGPQPAIGQQESGLDQQLYLHHLPASSSG